jgi:cbb3-type cytochrome oxidase subunit 1
MQRVARNFFTLAIIFALCGMALGIHMGMSGDHSQAPTHAHIMLAGWVTSAIFAFFYHLFPSAGDRTLATVHFWLTTVSVIGLVVSLYFLMAGNESMEPVLGIASIGFLLGMLLFAFIALPVIWRK